MLFRQFNNSLVSSNSNSQDVKSFSQGNALPLLYCTHQSNLGIRMRILISDLFPASQTHTALYKH